MTEEIDVLNPPKKRPLTLETLDEAISIIYIDMVKRMNRIEKKLDDLLYSEGKSHV